MKNNTLLILLVAVSITNCLSGQEITQIFEGTDTLFALPSGIDYEQLTTTESLEDYELPDGRYRQYQFDQDQKIVGEEPKPIAILEFDLRSECLNGNFQKKNPDGKIIKQGSYVNGHIHGYWHEYNDSMDTPILTTYFEFGSTLEMIFYAPEGYKQRRMIYFHETPSDKKVLTTWFFPNGRLAMQGITQVQLDGQRMAKKVGQWRSWFMEGNVRSVEYYSEGSLNGECNYFYKDGKLSKKSFYKKGKLKKEVDFLKEKQLELAQVPTSK